MGTRSEVITLIVVDDQAAIREPLAAILDMQPDITVVATGADGHEAVALAAAHQPDVVLMDLNMPVLDGVSATAEITSAQPATAVVVLTTFADDQSIVRALAAGARGYLTKDSGRDDITRAVRAAAAGQSVLDPKVQLHLLTALRSQPSPVAEPLADPKPLTAVGLTRRETDVLALIGEGLSNRAIAERLFVSEATVKTHINNLFAKAHFADRVQAVRYALAHGLVSEQ